MERTAAAFTDKYSATSHRAKQFNPRGRTGRKRLSKKKGQESVCSMSSDALFVELGRWMAAKGWKSKKLKPALFPLTGRGLVAAENIKNGDIIISIPEIFLITKETVYHSELGLEFQAESKLFSTHELLALYLIFEKSKGNNSLYSPYINSLPTSFTVPLYCEEGEVESLPFDILKQALQQKETFNNAYSRMREFLAGKDSFQNFVTTGFEYEDFLWAWCVVNSRSVFMRENASEDSAKSCALAPFLDMLNHSSDVEMQAGFDSATRTYQIRTLTPFRKGSEVLINYGSHDNLRLYLEYGFAIPGNIHDAVPFSLNEIVDVVGQGLRLEASQKVLQKYNLLRSLFASRHGMSWNVTAAIQLLLTPHTKRETFWKTLSCDEGSAESIVQKLCVRLVETKITVFEDSLCLINNRTKMSDALRSAKCLVEEWIEVLKCALSSLIVQ